MSNDTTGAFDLHSTFVHLGLGSRAIPLADFSWDAEYLAGYDERFASDGAEGRLVTLGEHRESWSSWERHPAGEELVVILSGRADLIQEIDGREHRIELGPGQAAVQTRPAPGTPPTSTNRVNRCSSLWPRHRAQVALSRAEPGASEVVPGDPGTDSAHDLVANRPELVGPLLRREGLIPLPGR